ncbi:MAG: calcium-binding protein [Cyanobacteriota bacterium]|nr:calcium-binding protein [Cyanobacteriota bacterium]
MVLTPDFLEPLPRLLGTSESDNEVLTVQQAADVFAGGVFGLNGDDTIRGSAAADLIRGGKGNEDILGEGGDDNLFGDKNRDYLDGGFGNDNLRGGKGVDLLFGGEGADTLIGEVDVDIYKGGGGSDTFVLRRDQAGLVQDLGIITVIPGLPDDIQLPDAIVTDFNPGEDSLLLTQGVRKADLTFDPFNSFEEFNVNANVILPIILGAEPDGLDFLAKAGISLSELDPDGDGVLEGTAIKIDGGRLLGYVLNTAPDVLASLPDANFTTVEGII